jgi:hypothetical protein
MKIAAGMAQREMKAGKSGSVNHGIGGIKMAASWRNRGMAASALGASRGNGENGENNEKLRRKRSVA